MSRSLITVREGGQGHVVVRVVFVLAIAALLLWVPSATKTGTVGLWTDAAILSIAAMGLNLVYGYGGMLSVGHSAFFGVGAYTTAILVKDHSWEPLTTFPFAVVLAAVTGFLVARPATRVKGLYLVLVTLTIGLIFPALIRYQKLEWLTYGSFGIDSAGYKTVPDWAGFFVGDRVGREARTVFHYWMAVAGAAVAYVICRGVALCRSGRALRAVRDNERAASMMGVDVATTRAVIFGISAGLCALAGSLSTARTGVASPDGLYVTVFGSIVFLLAMIVGGAGTITGPLIGALTYVLVDDYTRDASVKGDGVIGWLFGWASVSPATLVLGAVVIAAMFVASDGIAGLVARITRPILSIVPAPVEPRPESGTTVAPVSAPSPDVPAVNAVG